MSRLPTICGTLSILLSRSYVIGIVPERDDTARDSVSGSFAASMTLDSAMLTTLSSFFVALHPSTVEVLVLTLAGSFLSKSTVSDSNICPSGDSVAGVTSSSASDSEDSTAFQPLPALFFIFFFFGGLATCFPYVVVLEHLMTQLLEPKAGLNTLMM